MGGADIAQGGAAGQVRPVGEALGGYPGLFAKLCKGGGGDGIGGIALVGVVLDDDALVHLRPVVPVGIFRVIGMDGMGIVRRDEEAGRQAAAQIRAQALRRPGQHILQEGGAGALFGAAAHLFIVKDAEHREACPLRRPEEALRAAEDALQIVQSRGGDVLFRRAPDGAGSAGIEEEVLCQHILLLHAQSISNEGVKLLRSRRVSEEGEHVSIGVKLFAVVGAAVHVDGHMGDEQQIPIHVQELSADLLPFPHDGAARHGEGPVQPGGADHAAVLFHVQPGVHSRRGHRCMLLDLEAGGVRVGGHHEKALPLPFRDAEGDERGGVAACKVPAAFFQIPSVLLPQLGIALRRQALCQVAAGVKRGGAFRNEGKQPLIPVFHVPSSLGRLPYIPVQYNTVSPT